MGNCSCVSFDSAHVTEATAKLVVHDGRFQEFSYPVKVSYLLQVYQNCFICNSDDMDFDDVVKAVHDNGVLQPGQLYFALPLDRLNRPLKAEEMAALAVKASSALAKSGYGEKLGSRRRQIVLFSGEDNGRGCRKVAPAGGGVGDTIDMSNRGRNRSGRGRRGGGKGKFAAVLNSIPE